MLRRQIKKQNRSPRSTRSSQRKPLQEHFAVILKKTAMIMIVHCTKTKEFGLLRVFRGECSYGLKPKVRNISKDIGTI